jgi:hypothetical protein
MLAAVCAEDRNHSWVQSRIFVKPWTPPTKSVRAGPLEQMVTIKPAPKSKLPRYREPVDPEMRRKVHNETQNARRAALRKPTMCIVCEQQPTGKRADALRCTKCERVNRLAMYKALHAKQKEQAKSNGR